jgi:hypothetical protein
MSRGVVLGLHCGDKRPHRDLADTRQLLVESMVLDQELVLCVSNRTRWYDVTLIRPGRRRARPVVDTLKAMRLRLVPIAAVLLGLGTLFTGTAAAQELVSVTVAGHQPGMISLGCGSGPVVSTPAEFTLTRTGDDTDGLTVSICWSGDLSVGTTILPASVAFTPGSSTATVTPMFASVPQTEGGLTLTVRSGLGYQPGDPVAATAAFSTYVPDAPPPLQVDPPPPVHVNPVFTG